MEQCRTGLHARDSDSLTPKGGCGVCSVTGVLTRKEACVTDGFWGADVVGGRGAANGFRLMRIRSLADLQFAGCTAHGKLVAALLHD